MDAPSIRRLILAELARNKTYAIPQPALLDLVNASVRPALTIGDLVKHLSWLKAQDMARFLPSALDPDNADARKWLITEAGEVALQK